MLCLPVQKNPLRTRADVERALLQLLEPVLGRFATLVTGAAPKF